MKRYLDAEKVKKKLLEVGFGCEDKINKWIDEIPAAIVVPFINETEETQEKEPAQKEKAHWVRIIGEPGGNPYLNNLECSSCGYRFTSLTLLPPMECPHCKADMTESAWEVARGGV